MQRSLVGSQDTSHLTIIPVLGYLRKLARAQNFGGELRFRAPRSFQHSRPLALKISRLLFPYPRDLHDVAVLQLSALSSRQQSSARSPKTHILPTFQPTIRKRMPGGER